MNKRMLVALAAVITLALAGPALAENLGVIDSQRIYSEYQEARDAEAVFEGEMRIWEQELGELEQKILGQQEKFRSQQLLLSEERLKAMQQEIQTQMQTYQTRKEEIMGPEGLAQTRNAELSQPINDRISTVVERIAAEDGFELVLDVATVTVVYMADSVDLTEKVLAELTAGAK